MRALFRLKGFSLPKVESHTSIQNTFVTQMQNLARPGSVLGYSAHRWVKRFRKPLWRTFAVSSSTMVIGLGLMGLYAVGAPTLIAHIGAWLFAVSILPVFGVVMAFGYSLNVMPETLGSSTRNRFLKVGAEVARKDRAVRSLLKEFGGQLDQSFPQQWWESVCLALEEYNRALDQRAQWEERQYDEQQLESVFIESVNSLPEKTVVPNQIRM